MIVKVYDKETEFFGDSVTGQKVMDHVMTELNEKNMGLSHLEIDGTVLNNSHIEYIDKNKDEIKFIEAFPIDRLSLVLENTALLRDSLAEFPPIMDVMAEDFRQGVSARGWKEFQNMINTFIFIDNAMKTSFATLMTLKKPEYNIVYDRARSEYQKLYEVLHNIEKSLNYNRPADAGDLIQKKVKPVVLKTVELLRKLEEVEVKEN